MNPKVKKFSKAFWDAAIAEAKSAMEASPVNALYGLLKVVEEFSEHLGAQNYGSEKANAARLENARKAGRPKGVKNMAPRSDKGVKRK